MQLKDLGSPFKNWRERQNIVDWENQWGAFQSQPQHEVDGNDSEGLCRSYELDDDDDDNVHFSRKLQAFWCLPNFVPPKIPKFEGKYYLENHLNKYKT